MGAAPIPPHNGSRWTGVAPAPESRRPIALGRSRRWRPQNPAPRTFDRPGHVLPVVSAAGGVLGRRGPAEAAVDLARLAGRREAAALCDIVSRDQPRRDGRVPTNRSSSPMNTGWPMCRSPISRRTGGVPNRRLFGWPRRSCPPAPATPSSSGSVGRPTAANTWPSSSVRPGADVPLPLHVHVECLTGDVFGSTACRCGADLDDALASMAAHGGGVVVYLRPSGSARGCGLFEGSTARTGRHVGDLGDRLTWILRDLGLYTIRLSEDTPAFGLVMFGDIRDTGLRAEATAFRRARPSGETRYGTTTIEHLACQPQKGQ